MSKTNDRCKMPGPAPFCTGWIGLLAGVFLVFLLFGLLTVVSQPAARALTTADMTGPTQWPGSSGSWLALPTDPSGTSNLDASLALSLDDGQDQGGFALVSSGMPVSIITKTLPTTTIGQLYSAYLAASGGTGNYVWKVSGLPSQLTLTSSTRTAKIGGYPTENGTFPVIVTVSDSAGNSATATLPLTVNYAVLTPLTIKPSGSSTGTIGVPYTATFTASGGLGTYVWLADNVPPGLILTTSDGTATIKGDPTLTGMSDIVLRAYDSINRNTDLDFILTIKEPPPKVVPTRAGTSSGLDNTPGDWMVGSSGGTLSTSDNSVSVSVPPKAFSKQVHVSMSPLPSSYPFPAGFTAASPQWSIQAFGAQPAQAVTVTLTYDPSVLGNLSSSQLGLYLYNPVSGTWTWVDGNVDTGSNTVTATTFSLGTFAVEVNEQVFQDMGQAPWAQTAVDTLLGANVVSGASPGQFDPEGNVTRAQFAVMLAKAARLTPVVTGTTPFADVPANAWYAPYLTAAYNDGLVSGADGVFEPDAPVTREQMAVMVANLLGGSATAGDATQFTDYASIDQWAVKGVDLVLGSSLMSGFPDGTFRPLQLTTRAEAAVVLYNYLQSNNTQ